MRYLDPVVPEIMEMLDVVVEAVDYINENQSYSAQYLFNDINEAIGIIINSVNSLLPNITIKNKIEVLNKNIVYSVTKIFDLCKKQKHDDVEFHFKYELVGLISYWKKYLKFFLVDSLNEETLKKYNEDEETHIQQLSKLEKQDVNFEFKYDVSIVVLFYNNKKMTEECLDSIEKYTKSINYELITINNGSDEDTTKWAESLTHKKKIYFKYNMSGVTLGTFMERAWQVTEGKYTVFVSNDVIVTENWLSNLLKCIDSDSSICWAVPLCNSLSNLQTIPVSYTNMDEMQSFAKQFNASDSRKWEERARLFPFLGIMRPDVVEKMNVFFTPYFSYDMFADDDMSVRIRRAGYKQILCKDTFVHHYGSATIKEEQFGVMDKGRKQFYDKYKVDAWESLSAENIYFSDLIVKAKECTNILTINPKFGETTLAVKNKIKNCGGRDICIDAITDDKRYIRDCEVLAENYGLVQDLESVAGSKKYDYVLCNGDIEDYNSELQSLFINVRKHLNQNGIMLLACKNPYYYGNGFRTMLLGDISESYQNDPINNLVKNYISIKALEKELNFCGYLVLRCVNVTDENSLPKYTDKLLKVMEVEDIKHYREIYSIYKHFLIVK
nr:glycosyltransferase [uncultured Aminipila sp.]